MENGNGIRGSAKEKGHLFASEKRYSRTLPLLAGQEKTLTSPSHSESAYKYTISHIEGKAEKINNNKQQGGGVNRFVSNRFASRYVFPNVDGLGVPYL